MLRPHLYPALIGAALCALALGGCSAHHKPSALEVNLANAAKDVVIPFEAERANNPVPDTPLTLAQGQAVFQARCALCHSSDGHSQNPLGLAMYPPAMDLTSPHVQSWKDQELYWIIQNGIRLTGMPGWQGIISDPDAWKLARYIHALPQLTPARLTQLSALLAPPPATAKTAAGRAAAPSLATEIAYGRRLVRQEGCLMCHTLDGEGGGDDDAPDLTTEAQRHRIPAWLLGHFKDPGAYSPDTDMPAFNHLTSSQLQALVALLENAKAGPGPAAKRPAAKMKP